MDYIYEVVVGPNLLDDSVSPLTTLNSLVNSTYLQGKVASQIPSLDLTYTMTAYELIFAKPRIRDAYLNLVQLTDSNAMVEISSW